MDRLDFVNLMETLAGCWNAGDSRRALELFTDDAVYMEPPDSQRYVGREELWEFFGRDGRISHGGSTRPRSPLPWDEFAGPSRF